MASQGRVKGGNSNYYTKNSRFVQGDRVGREHEKTKMKKKRNNRQQEYCITNDAGRRGEGKGSESGVGAEGEEAKKTDEKGMGLLLAWYKFLYSPVLYIIRGKRRRREKEGEKKA